VVGLVYLYILAVEEVMGQQVEPAAARISGFSSPDQFYPGAAQVRIMVSVQMNFLFGW